MSDGLKLSILLRIGDGQVTEVAETNVPLRAHAVKDDTFGTVHIELDWEQLHQNVAAALHEVADSFPAFAPNAAGRVTE